MPAALERTFTKNGKTAVTTDASTATWLLSEGWTEQGAGTVYTPPTTGQQLESRVGDLEVATAATEARVETAILRNRMQFAITGGGILDVGPTSVYWLERFIAISVGRGATLLRDGYISITMPPNGTVIPGFGGAPNRTAGSSAPLGDWEALYYEIQPGDTSTMIPSRFKLVHYMSDFKVPDNWLLIAIRNSEQANSELNEVRFANGTTMTGRYAPTPWSGYSWYGAPWSDTRGWRKVNGVVYGAGLLNFGTAGVTFMNLPAKWRPGSPLIFASAGAISSQNHAEIRIYNDGNILGTHNGGSGGNQGYISFSGINFVPLA